jgi:5-oxoprolinase (ATP-hydrolysing) subunit A
MQPVLEPFGDRAWRVRLPEGYDVASRRRLLVALRALPHVVDGVVAERHALAVLQAGTPLETLRQAVAEAVARAGDPGSAQPSVGAPAPRAAPGDAPGEPRHHQVEVRYEGADLVEVARASGLLPEEVMAMHAECTYEVAMMGFLPGFAYLRALPPRLVLPRRATPRARVPALSVAVAGPYSAIYPFASPGGWHLLGVAVGFVPFDAQRGAALALGDRVRFVPTTGLSSPPGSSVATDAANAADPAP